MKCKCCGEEYIEDDSHNWGPPPYYGWHHLYGECFLCFCYTLFGGWLGPPTGRTDWKPYPIGSKPEVVPINQYTPRDFGYDEDNQNELPGPMDLDIPF